MVAYPGIDFGIDLVASCGLLEMPLDTEIPTAPSSFELLRGMLNWSSSKDTAEQHGLEFILSLAAHFVCRSR